MRLNFNKVGNLTLSEKTPAHGLVLLGTVHTDRLGFVRLQAFLSEYKPDLILLELSPFGLQYRKEHARALRKTFFSNLRAAAEKLEIDFRTALLNSHILGILIQIALPFEYRASMTFAKGTGVKVVPVDDSEFSKEWIGTWQELISTANLRSLLQLETAAIPVHLQYEQAARGICEPSSVADIRGIGNLAPWQRREDHIAGHIRSQLSMNVPEKPLYVGGWQHLLSGGRLKTVRDILGIEEPLCLLLDRASATVQV